MESPNKPPDDARPAFDDDEEEDQETALQELDKSLVKSHAQNEVMGTPYDYAESVSSSAQGEGSIEGSKRCVSESTKSVIRLIWRMMESFLLYLEFARMTVCISV